MASDITTAPIVTTTTPIIPARLEMIWQQAPTQPAFGEQDVIHSVVEGGPGLVAVGTAWTRPAGRDSGGWNEESAVWTSTDGLTWERVTGLDGQQIVLTDLANGPGGLVGVSFLDSIYGAYEETGPPIWISPDGTSWSRVTGNEKAFGDSATISGITAGGPGYVAVGADGDVIEAAIWTSADGLMWTRIQQGLGDGYEESLVYEVAYDVVRGHSHRRSDHGRRLRRGCMARRTRRVQGRGQLTLESLESDAAEIYIKAPRVDWERKYPTQSVGTFDGCHGPSIYPPGNDGHLWIHFLADGTIELYWHFDYYLADNGEKGRSRETVRQNFSMAAVSAPVDWAGEWLGSGTGEWQGTVQFGWFLVENGRVITRVTSTSNPRLHPDPDI